MPQLHFLISLPPTGSDGEVIPVLEVHELLSKIKDILENAVLKQCGYTDHILAYLCNSACKAS